MAERDVLVEPLVVLDVLELLAVVAVRDVPCEVVLAERDVLELFEPFEPLELLELLAVVAVRDVPCEVVLAEREVVVVVVLAATRCCKSRAFVMLAVRLSPEELAAADTRREKDCSGWRVS